jgi:hypothetical protein
VKGKIPKMLRRLLPQTSMKQFSYKLTLQNILPGQEHCNKFDKKTYHGESSISEIRNTIMETIKNISQCIKRLRSTDKLETITYMSFNNVHKHLRQTWRSADKKKTRPYIPTLQF